MAGPIVPLRKLAEIVTYNPWELRRWIDGSNCKNLEKISIQKFCGIRMREREEDSISVRILPTKERNRRGVCRAGRNRMVHPRVLDKLNARRVQEDSGNSWPRCTSFARGEEVRSLRDECQRFRFYGRLSNFLTYKRDRAYQVSHQMFLTVLIPPGITL